MKSAAIATLIAASSAAAGVSAHATFAVKGENGNDYSVTDVKSGAMKVSSVSMVPPHKWDKWKAGTSSIVTVEGTTEKSIIAGTFKWQLYETGVTSFVAAGNSPFFQCDNKGCDPNAPVALKWKKGTSGDFTLQLTAALPQAKGTNKDFRLVIWAEDQDHEPYDFSATINFSYDSVKNTFSSAVAESSETLSASQLTVHHADNGLGSGGDAHCMEITISDPANNEYWKAHGYQYPDALWPRGGCDRKKYNYFNRKTEIAAGASMVTLGIHKDVPHDNANRQSEFYRAAVAALDDERHDNRDAQEKSYAAAVKAFEEASQKNSLKRTFMRGVKSKLKQQEAANAEDDDWSSIYMITNPSSPMGKQHCQELDNPGGKSSKYWAAKGWKYSSPPWTPGKCDRNRFNFVNREMQNLDGYDGVTFWYLGIQV